MTQLPDPAPPEAQAADPQGRGPGLHRQAGHFGLWLLLSLPIVGLVVVFLALAITHRALSFPDWMVTRFEARANAALAGRMTVTLAGGADVIVDEGIVPRVRFHDVELTRANGTTIAVFPELRTTLYAQPLLRGHVVPRGFRIRGALIALRRLEDGRFDFGFNQGQEMPAIAVASLSEAVEEFERVFEVPALAMLERVQIENVALRVDDLRLGRVWHLSGDQMRLTQDDEKIAMALDVQIAAAGEVPARVSVTGATRKRGRAAEFAATITDVPARDLAVQSPALAALQVLDAPISGSLRSGLDDAGALTGMNAVLEIGAGAVHPDPAVAAIPFDGGKVYLGYDPVAQRVSFTDLRFDSRAIRLRANGQTLIRDFERGLPRSILGQVQITDLQLDPEGLFESPARFSGGEVDLRLRLDPFEVELGQVQLHSDETRISMRGGARVRAQGWHVALDTAINAIGAERMLALWPTFVVPKTRDWVAQNVTTGELHNVRAALRIRPAEEPELALNYEFRGADVRILRTLPNVKQGRGFAAILGQRHGLMVEEGHVVAPSGGSVEVADTVMVVPDVRIKPPPAVVKLRTRSQIPAALSLLDQPPFEFMRKAGQPTDLAEGWADALTVLKLRLAQKVAPEDVSFDVTARLTEVSSEKIVPGRTLTAEAFDLRADRAGISLSGKGALSGVPFDARWSQAFGPEAQGRSTVEGHVQITPAALDAFDIALPRGALTGKGWGRLRLDLRRGEPTRYDVATDLKGIALSIPQIGFAMGAQSTGRLALSGALGQPPTVEALTLEAPGLSAEGNLTLRAAGGLERARFDRLAIANWFTGAADLVGRGGAAPDVVVREGRFDLRRFTAGSGSGGGAGGGKITAALDRLQVSDSIALTGFRGEFSTRGGFSGTFNGRINGAAPVVGTLAPHRSGRSAVRLRADDAGQAMAAAGIFDRARGGSLDMTLTPSGRETYDGQVKMANLRVRNAPVLASLLSAASVIGLLEQLNGEGLLFSEVDGAFRLTPNGVSVTRGEAIGASMGVTMQGNFYPSSGKIDMQGVVSPFYLLNGIGQILTRRGEGLFGVTYRLSGSKDAPQITVNPLSILTPGMFREIFRRAPPEVLSE